MSFTGSNIVVTGGNFNSQEGAQAQASVVVHVNRA